MKRSDGHIFDSPKAKKIVDSLEGLSSDDLRAIAVAALGLFGADRALAKLEECDESFDVRSLIKATCGKELLEIEETYPLG